MACFQRAAVLSERGKLWTLMQNVARSMLNAINTLFLAASRFGKEARENTVSTIYGLACRPLYFVAGGLVELLVACGISSAFPLAANLTFTPGLDDINGVGVSLIRQVVFLAIHVLYVHQHWEKVINLGLQFDNATK